jgi:hypothetical protein
MSHEIIFQWQLQSSYRVSMKGALKDSLKDTRYFERYSKAAKGKKQCETRDRGVRKDGGKAL